MYVLELDVHERDYLLRLLKAQRASNAKLLTDRLRTADDVFGIVMWSNDDIKSKLEECKIPATPQIIEDVRRSYYGRHIADRMVECGWDVLEDCILQLKG